MKLLANCLIALLVVPLLVIASALLCAGMIVGMAGIGFWAALER